MSDLSIGFAANLVFAVLLYTYAIAMVWAWRSAARRPLDPLPGGFRAKLRVLDEQTRPATTVTFFFAVSLILGAIVGQAL